MRSGKSSSSSSSYSRVGRIVDSSSRGNRPRSEVPNSYLGGACLRWGLGGLLRGTTGGLQLRYYIYIYIYPYARMYARVCMIKL